MSQMVNADAFKAEAETAADNKHEPKQYLEKYDPNLHCIWKTHYYRRLGELEREECLAAEVA